MSVVIKEWASAIARQVFGCRLVFHETGFHGDLYLISLVEYLLNCSECFIETGTHVGSSLAHVARMNSSMHCFSCEPNSAVFTHALKNTSQYKNVFLFNENSSDFLTRIIADESLKNANILFWLDAHGYGFEWPLREEIERITTHWDRALILIDDFFVPGAACFGCDKYKGQVCSYDYVKSSINSKQKYRIYYPNYTDRTSTYHPLRGWGLIDYGYSGELSFPKEIAEKVRLGSI